MRAPQRYARPKQALPRIAALLMLAWSSIANATITQLPGLVREPFTLDVTLPDGGHAALDSFLTRPDGPGPFPLVIINHGLPRDAAVIARMTPEAYAAASVAFARHGYAAVAVERPGFGLSTGKLNVTLGPCGSRDYARNGRDWGAELLAALASLRRKPWADPNRVVLVGHSAGGMAALAAAETAPPGVVAVVNFAGGVGSRYADYVCQADNLIEAMRQFGANAHVPSLWVYSENDHYFGPDLARRMFDAYASGGAPAIFGAAPPFGQDGHLLISAGEPSPWWPLVADFLARQHMPTRLLAAEPPQAALPPPSGLDETGKQDFAGYIRSRTYEKAYATDGAGHYARTFGQRTQEAAKAAAMARCDEQQWTCSLYAIGNTLVSPAAARR